MGWRLKIHKGIRCFSVNDLQIGYPELSAVFPDPVGFGISTPEQAKKMADQSDGAIVGSAIVKLCGTYGKDCVPKVKAYVKEMKDALR